MVVKEFQALDTLEVDVSGTVYAIVPSADDLRRMGELRRATDRARRANVNGSTKADDLRALLRPEDRDMLDDDVIMLRVELGSDTYDRMVADGVPLPTIEAIARYSFMYHVMGEAVADLTRTVPADDDSDTDAAGDTVFPKPSKSGRPTASGSRTKTASTSGTDRSRNGSGKSNTRRHTPK